ncbi:hypothetical protein C8J56DRAFT_1042113 [Mycena floridula]|nr:hypothetical protein C8J56DRAFT_1042113 [Mycena floridula]
MGRFTRDARAGEPHPSPYKRRNRRKTRQIVDSAPRDLRARQLNRRLDEILQRALAPSPEPPEPTAGVDSDDDIAMVDDSGDEDYREEEIPAPDASSPEPDLLASGNPHENFENSEPFDLPKRKPRRLEPDDESIELYEKWQDLIPTLVDPYLAFQKAHHAQALPTGMTFLGPICTGGCNHKVSKIQCLYMDCVFMAKVHHCHCHDVFHVLLQNGLFPASPTAPRTAFSFGILEMYRALFERSCDAINAMSSAMQTFYQRRGFLFASQNGTLSIDPFRKSLSSAVQWYDSLGVMVYDRMEQAVDLCLKYIDEQSARSTASAEPSVAPSPAPETSTSTAPSAQPGVERGPSTEPILLTPGECDRILQDLCPACFGGRLYGRSFQEGGDIHVSTDGNFHHKHFKKAGDSASFYKPKHVLPKDVVDKVRSDILDARRRPTPKKKIPDEAIDACEESHQAAKPERKKAQPQFDDNGLMSLVCRHNIPLFVANIDTPGEGQQYAVALILHLFSLLPPQATVVVLYDLACVLDRSSQLYELFPASIFDLNLQPLNVVLRDLICLTRHASRSRRIWMIDRLIQSTAANHREMLGEWIRKKITHLNTTIAEQHQILWASPDSAEALRLQWDAQKAEQTSIRAHLPARLKKQLQQVLSLQADIATIESSIKAVRTALNQSPGSADSLARLRILEATHARLRAEADQLYASLNVAETYPELEGIDVAFVQVLLLACDLKMSLRKVIVGSFNEVDRLDQAVGGGNAALGKPFCSMQTLAAN